MTEVKSISRNKINTLELIRDQLRDKISFTRKKQRDIKINKQRLVFRELDNQNNSEEFIIATAITLRGKSLSIQQYRNLQNIFVQVILKVFYYKSQSITLQNY
jgi:hypothetical protein